MLCNDFDLLIYVYTAERLLFEVLDLEPFPWFLDNRINSKEYKT